LNGPLRRSIGILGLACVLSGCGPSERPATEAKGPITGPNQKLGRIQNDEYKKMLGKDGKPAWKPGQMPKK
jgi:hypothetical protein